MEQKFYVASKGNSYLSLTNHPGTLTESDILNNLERMIQADLEEELPWKELRSRARWFYEENIERILEMVKPGEELVEIPKEEAEEDQSLTFSEWKEWEFPRSEWD